MALNKIKTIKGVECSYWRILQLNQNYDRSDAVITLGLYKDKATREADPTAIMDQYQTDLAVDYHNDEFSGEDEMTNIDRSIAYSVLMTKAVAEAAKVEEKDEALAFFADATEA